LYNGGGKIIILYIYININNMINGLNPTSLGGGYTGISPKQTISYKRSGEDVINRRKLVNAIDKANMQNNINGYGRIATPFRAAWGTQDFLGRMYYVDGTQPNQISGKTVNGLVLNGLGVGSAVTNNDGKGVLSTSGNSKLVASGGDYCNFKKLMAINSNFNDIGFGGDSSNASYQTRVHKY
jgi:hypothetical protein